jgi:hypothetical protein
MNKWITELLDLNLDDNSIDLSDINSSHANLQSQIVSMNSPKLITPRVPTLEIFF